MRHPELLQDEASKLRWCAVLRVVQRIARFHLPDFVSRSHYWHLFLHAPKLLMTDYGLWANSQGQMEQQNQWWGGTIAHTSRNGGRLQSGQTRLAVDGREEGAWFETNPASRRHEVVQSWAATCWMVCAMHLLRNPVAVAYLSRRGVCMAVHEQGVTAVADPTSRYLLAAGWL